GLPAASGKRPQTHCLPLPSRPRRPCSRHTLTSSARCARRTPGANTLRPAGGLYRQQGRPPPAPVQVGTTTVAPCVSASSTPSVTVTTFWPWSQYGLVSVSVRVALSYPVT